MMPHQTKNTPGFNVGHMENAVIPLKGADKRQKGIESMILFRIKLVVPRLTVQYLLSKI